MWLKLFMKTKLARLVLLGAGLLMVQGCIAFPPLVQVERKESTQPPPPNPEMMRRLDSIDRRLNDLEKKVDAERHQEQQQAQQH